MDNYLVVDASVLDKIKHQKMWKQHHNDSDYAEFFFGVEYGACVQTVVNGSVRHVDNVMLGEGVAVIARRSIFEKYFGTQELSKLKAGRNYAVMPYNKDKSVVFTTKIVSGDEIIVLDSECTHVLYIVC